MNIINYVISFTGVIRATMYIFSSDASWIVETEGDTEKTDPTHSTGRSCFTIIIIIMKTSSSFSVQIHCCRFCEFSVSSNCGCSVRMFCQLFFHLPTGAAPPYQPNICLRTIDIPFLSTCPCHLSMHFRSTPSIASLHRILQA